MDKSTRDHTEKRTENSPVTGERLVYVMPQDAIQSYTSDEVSLLDIWNILWRSKWLIVVVTSAFMFVSVVVALSATEWFRADVLLAPAGERSSEGLSGPLGGIASLVGVSVGGGGSVEPLAVLRSRDFTGAFIEEMNLLPVLFADEWSVDECKWASDDPADCPDIRDAVEVFDQNVRSVSENSETGLVTLAIEWTEPELAARWANLLVARLNNRMRQRALVEAESNLTYLRTGLSETTVVALQQSIGRLLEVELEKVMLARGNEEFAFRVIDRAQAPKDRSRPRRTQMVVLSTFAGWVLAMLVVFANHAVRRARTRPKTGED
jgi:uncharacterized protein involved in exopolysaccharide biosynthesis